MSRYSHSPAKGGTASAERGDVRADQASCIRVDGGSTGATVRNDGPCSVDNALAVAQDTNYGSVTTVTAGSTQAVASGAQRDFWVRGNGRCRLIISRP